MTFAEIPVYRDGRRMRRTLLVDLDVAETLRGERIILVGGYPFLRDTAIHRTVAELVKNDGKVCHHINEDKLDCRRVNLEVFASRLDHGGAPHPLRNLLCALIHRHDTSDARRIVDALHADRRERMGATA